MCFLIQRIAAGDILRGEEHRLGGERAVIVAIGRRCQHLRFRMAHLRTCHQFHIMDRTQAACPLQHCLPRPLAGMRIGLLHHTTFGQDGAIDTIHRVAGILLGLTHSIAVLTSITVYLVVVVLIAELRSQFQVFAQLQLCIDDSHHRAVGTLLRRVGTLLEDIEVGSCILTTLHVVVVVEASLAVVGLEVRIGTARVIYRIGEATRIGHEALLFTLVSKHRDAQLQNLIDIKVGLQRHIVAIVLDAFHRSLFLVVACRCVVVGTVGATADAGIILLVEHIAEQDIVPICIDGTQVVDALLGSRRQGIPSTRLVGIELAQLIEDVRNPTLVFAIAITTT